MSASLGILYFMMAGAVSPETAPTETVWEARKAIGDAVNPADCWACGWLPATGDDFTLYHDWGRTSDGMSCWWDARGGFAAGIVSCAWLDDDSPLAKRPWLVLHPGQEGQRATVRWTAPTDGFVKVEAAFGGASWGVNTSSDARISFNGSCQFAAPVTGTASLAGQTPDPYRTAGVPGWVAACRYLAVAKGDTIDFSVGMGEGGFSSDSTALLARVCLCSRNTASVSGLARGADGRALARKALRASASWGDVTATTDATGHFALVLPADEDITLTIDQYAPVNISPGEDRKLVFVHTVDHSYTFGPPQRITASWPGGSAKTCVDIHDDGAVLSWTYHDVRQVVQCDQRQIELCDHFIRLRPLLDGTRFAQHTWKRSDAGLPIVEDRYAGDEVTLAMRFIGGRDAMVALVTAENSSDKRRAVTVMCENHDQGVYYSPPITRRGHVYRWLEDAPHDVLITDDRHNLTRAGTAPRISVMVGDGGSQLCAKHQMGLSCQLEPGGSWSSWIIRPYDATTDDLPAFRSCDWNEAYVEAERAWTVALEPAVDIEIPDAGLVKGFYSSLADLLSLQEPAANGVLSQMTGSEIYRFPNAGDCAGGVVGLAYSGYVENAQEAFRNQFHSYQKDGNWAGGVVESFVGFSGMKCWVAMVFLGLTQDRDFLEDLFPIMLRAVQYHEMRRDEHRGPGHDPSERGYGLIWPTMRDCGNNDATGQGIYFGHNTWAVYADRVAGEVARMLGKDEEAAWLEAVYERSYRDLLAAYEAGAVDEGEYRWLPGAPNDGSGSTWGITNPMIPCNLLSLEHPLMLGAVRKMEEQLSDGGTVRFMGWMPEGTWTGLCLDQLGFYYLSTGQSDRFVDMLYATLNHATYLNTWCEERGIECHSKNLSGDVQHIWTSGIFAQGIRHALLFEDGRELQMARGTAREWLTSGEPVGIADGPTRFGRASFSMRWEESLGQLSGWAEVDPNRRPERLRLFLRLPAGMTVDRVIEAEGARLEQVAQDGATTPTLVWDSPSQRVVFRVAVSHQ